MNGLLILSLLTGFWRPAVKTVGISELQFVRQLVGLNRDVRTGPKSIDWQEAVPGRMVVGFAEGGAADAEARVKAAGGRVLSGSLTRGNFLVAEFPVTDRTGTEALIRDIAQGPTVRYAEPLIRCHALYTPNDPYYSLHQWGNWVMYADKVWDLTLGSRDVKVGVVDEGIDYTHPDLVQSFDPSLRGYDFVDKDPDPRPVNGNEMHGSHVGGIIAAGIGNSVGIAGWAGVTLYSCRALNDSGSGSTSDIADAIRWAADHGVRVINMSFGSQSPTSVLEDAVNYAWNHGVLLVGASGNDGLRGIFFPAAYANCIAVGALDTTGSLAGFSNYGPEQELTAPGVGILSTTPGNEYYYMDGTSMASPEVAGFAALLFSYRPALTNQQVRAIIDASAIDMGSPGRDEYYGYGLVNGWRAFQLAQMYGADLEPVHALQSRLTLPAVLRGQDLLRLLPAGNVVLDAQGRVQSAAPQPGVYFIRAPGSAAMTRVTVVQ